MRCFIYVRLPVVSYLAVVVMLARLCAYPVLPCWVYLASVFPTGLFTLACVPYRPLLYFPTFACSAQRAKLVVSSLPYVPRIVHVSLLCLARFAQRAQPSWLVLFSSAWRA